MESRPEILAIIDELARLVEELRDIDAPESLHDSCTEPDLEAEAEA